MAIRYYASISFPASARKIKEIDDYLNDANLVGKYGEIDGLGELSHMEAADGEIELADLLEEYEIPYDHYHQDTENDSVRTVRVRYMGDGNRVALTEHAEDDLLSNFAKEVKSLLEKGQINQTHALLDSVILPEFEPISSIVQSNK